MNDSKISVRYSKALFEKALEKSNTDKVNDDMILIAEVCKAPETMEFLENPVIVPSKKSAILHKMLENNVEEITMSMLDLLVKNGRESFLPDIARNFIHETLKHKGITRAILTTAVPVDAQIKKQVSGLVADVFSTKVELREIVDPEIIGGFILRVDDSYIDASLKSKLRKVKKELLGSIKSR